MSTTSVSVAVLLDGVGSGIPGGGVTVAVFVMGLLAAAVILPCTVYVIVLPEGKSTPVSSILPEPLAVKPVAPPVPTAVNVTPVSATGSVSATVVH